MFGSSVSRVARTLPAEPVTNNDVVKLQKTSRLKYGLEFTHLNLDGLHLGVTLQRHDAILAANAGVLIAANRHLRRGFTPAVDPADAGFQLVDKTVGTVEGWASPRRRRGRIRWRWRGE